MRYLVIKFLMPFAFVVAYIFTTICFADTKDSTSAVNVAKATIISVPDEIQAVGHIQAIQQVNLSFGNDGKLTNKYFNNGAHVLKGEVIAKLDTTQDEADLKSLQAKLNITQQTYQRMQILAKSGAISKETLDEKKADLVEAQTEVAKQQSQIQNDQIIAPFTGVLGNFTFDVGAYITSGTTLVQLTQLAPVKVQFSIPANFKPKIALGNEVNVTTATYPKSIFHGIVSYISPTVDSTTGTIALEAKIPNEENLLSPGMFVNVSQLIKTNEQILTIPNTAIQADQNGQYVFVVNKNNTVKKVYIKQGIIRGNWAEVLSGISQGTTVVSIGAFKLSDGDAIHISNIAPPPDSNHLLLPHIEQKSTTNNKAQQTPKTVSPSTPSTASTPSSPTTGPSNQ